MNDWTDFERAEVHVDLNDPKTQADIEHMLKISNRSREEIEAGFLDLKNDLIYLNNKYQVNVRRPGPVGEGEFGIAHLSIKRLDKGSDIPWRDLQRIKNELLGEEYEAVELFPAESRLVDSANQRHLWAVDDPRFRWPMGWNERLVSDESPEGGHVKQDPR